MVKTRRRERRRSVYLQESGIVECVVLRRRVIEPEDPFSSLQLKLDEIVDVTIMD